MEQKLKPMQLIVPIALIVLVGILIGAIAIEKDVNSKGQVGMIMLMLGLSLIIMGIFQDQYKHNKPILNLGVILCGGILTILSSMQLAYIAEEFHKALSFVMIAFVFLIAIIYIVVLSKKKSYEDDEQDDA